MEGFQSWRILHLELETLLAPVAGASAAFSSAVSARNSAALSSPKVDYCRHRRKTSCSVFKVICEDDSDNFFYVFYLLVVVVFGNFPFIARDALYVYRTFSGGTLTFLGTHDFRMTKNCGAGFLSSILLLGSLLCRSSLLRHT